MLEGVSELSLEEGVSISQVERETEKERLGTEQKNMMLTVNRNRNVSRGWGEAEDKPEVVSMTPRAAMASKVTVKHLFLIPTVLGSQEKVIDGGKT